jgi:translation elongation factor EF-Tu-like GTPase
MGLFGIFKTAAKKPKESGSKPVKKRISNKETVKPKKSLLKGKKTAEKPALKKAAKKKPGKEKKQKKITKPKEIGRVTHYFGKISVGIIKLKAPLAVGEKVHIKGANDDFKQMVKSMQVDHKSIDKAKRGDEVGIKVSKKVHENDRVYIVKE